MTRHEKTELAKVGAWLAACATVSAAIALAGVLAAIFTIVFLAMIADAIYIWVRHR